MQVSDNPERRWLHSFVLPLTLSVVVQLAPHQTHFSWGSHMDRDAACHVHEVGRTFLRCPAQVQYPMRTGRWLHALALPLALAAVSLLPRYRSGPGRWALCGKGSVLWAASTLACIALPACLGAARVAVTGERGPRADHLCGLKSCVRLRSNSSQEFLGSGSGL